MIYAIPLLVSLLVSTPADGTEAEKPQQPPQSSSTSSATQAAPTPSTPVEAGERTANPTHGPPVSAPVCQDDDARRRELAALMLLLQVQSKRVNELATQLGVVTVELEKLTDLVTQAAASNNGSASPAQSAAAAAAAGK